MSKLIGKKVMNRHTKDRGTIISIDGNRMKVNFYGETFVYEYPSAFETSLIVQDIELQDNLEKLGALENFDSFKFRYIKALNVEINYLKETGGKKHRVIDGERLPSDKNTFLYAFDTDSEMHFPDGTTIKLWLPNMIIPAYVVSCEDFTIVIRASEYIGENIETIEFTAEPWQLLESLNERIVNMDYHKSNIAYELACKGRSKIDVRKSVKLGKDVALRTALSQSLTFIWGPPGTGKTTTLAKIALEKILNGNRVLMLSYSNVSVDGALLKVADMADKEPGTIIRYGYPRIKELLESKTLTSYAYVLSQNPDLEQKYKELLNEKRKLKQKEPRRLEINKQLNNIRRQLLDKEKELMQEAKFIATTVSKAVVDKAIYSQQFDVVIFDEASMAYVPQIVFAASLAKNSFCCLGDFRQLPAIVQNPYDNSLKEDIFEYTGITDAIENGYGHEWLVMLNNQFRMHPAIAEFVGMHMYHGLLKTPKSVWEKRQMIAECLPMKKESMSMIDLSDTYSVCIKTKDGSRINLLSAMISMKLAELTSDQYGVGIITPYSAQSRLILAMVRDMQERKEKYMGISCATVHQFQGSEKPVIIYDAVDCFRMPYPGMLLTSMKNDTANRLFNVAITRAQGKFILVANKDYMFKKSISKTLIFTQSLKMFEQYGLMLKGEEILKQIGTAEKQHPDVFLGDRDEIDSWERFLTDIENAKEEIHIEVPGAIDDDLDALDDLEKSLSNAEEKGICIRVRAEEKVVLPKILEKYKYTYPYITTPVTIIDKNIIWYGEPLTAADFISEGNVIETKQFPCLRFEGKYTARMLKALLEISEK